MQGFYSILFYIYYVYSAGVGRTGVYLAIDYLMDQAEAESGIDIYQCVNKLRQQRTNMVQTLVSDYTYSVLFSIHTNNIIYLFPYFYALGPIHIYSRCLCGAPSHWE